MLWAWGRLSTRIKIDQEARRRQAPRARRVSRMTGAHDGDEALSPHSEGCGGA